MKKIIVVLHNIRSIYNVGAILRTAEGLGVEKVVYSGYTPRYEDETLLPHLREKLNHQIAKAALGAEKLVPQVKLGQDSSAKKDASEMSATGVDNGKMSSASDVLLTFLQKCAIMEGYTLVGLENNLSDDELEKRLILGERQASDGEKVDLGEKIVLVLGEEVGGIPAEIRAKMDYFLEIPMHGRKESFNVSVATGIALWGLQNCH